MSNAIDMGDIVAGAEANVQESLKEALTWIGTTERKVRAAVNSLKPLGEVSEELKKDPGSISDGYHTFDELYHHRAILFSVIVRDHKDVAWKSKKHHDGTMYDGMFIVGVNTPQGQATYHYDMNPYWDKFDCVELHNAPVWDGHTPEDAIKRIGGLA